MTDSMTAVHEGGHALVGYAVYGDRAIALIRLRGRNRQTVIPAERRCVKRRLVSGNTQDVSSPNTGDEIAAVGSVAYGGLAAEKILLPPPLDWSHGIRDCQGLVKTITENGLPYPTFDASIVGTLRENAEGTEPYVCWFNAAHQFLRDNERALAEFSGFLESYRDARVPGDEANAAIKKALGW